MTVVTAHTGPKSDSDKERSRVLAHFMHDNKHDDLYLPISMLRAALTETKGVGLLTLQLPGEDKPRRVIIEKLVKDSGGSKLDHLVLKEVSDKDQVRAKVPVIPKGKVRDAEGMKVALRQLARVVEVKGPLTCLEHALYVDVSNLRPNQSVKAKNVEVPNGMLLCSDPEQEVFKLTPVTETLQ